MHTKIGACIRPVSILTLSDLTIKKFHVIVEQRWERLSDDHFYGKPGNSGDNSNGTAHPCGKKGIPFEVLPFSRFYRKDLNFFVHLSR